MSQESDLAALIEMLEKIVTDGLPANRTGSELAHVEHLIRHVKSGQAEPNLVVALLAFNGTIKEQQRFRQRSTDSSEQGRTGLAARGMKLADDLFAQLSQSQREWLREDRLRQDSTARDGGAGLPAGRRH